ncbi:peptidoglycan DD-metalloendopeptidase family protein [Sedimenticola selenatireducens]|uniref:Peptidoglycan DD-metalloendopeptidase family protein n=1 Tax=Sedimenticola selenatireducens TaxID=191960 RepID=A0A558DVP5_9GAMM|nr:peptidoglycan DD-metalloendopeptidase family protein [Sedimenticola selenatireducens]TVO77816.1 peptidoglycan DD-metalloendopeptidase family protein [Sedimenticola selenatireducens]TVT65121.1 MAG: peptidoglycan DD-metalloendopeptidase family protein [Sedimenticola selenatireducens]
MRNSQTGLHSARILLFAMIGTVITYQTVAFAQNRSASVMEKLDKDQDGKISRKEWRKKNIFAEVDLDKDGSISLNELKQRFGETEESNNEDRPDPVSMAAIRRSKLDDVIHQKSRGLFETGLKPIWRDDVICRGIDEWYGKDYTPVRPKESYHGGIDLPAPFGTPVLAIMDGEVIALYEGKKNPRGIEVVLRHTPEESGLPFYLYSRYTHFDSMPKLIKGQQIKMGEVIGETGNTGVQGCELKGIPCKRPRRSVTHYDILYSISEKYYDTGNILVPFEAHWMDPIALYRKQPPFDSHSMRALPEVEKMIAISYKLDSGEYYPADTKMIWPYSCRKK